MLYVRFFFFLSQRVQRFTEWRWRKITTKWLIWKRTCIICKYIFLCFFFSVFFCFAMQAKPNVVSFVIYYCEWFSLMLKLLAYFNEATVSLYFAQSVLVKISTNPLSAELRRRIIMAERDVYNKQNRKQKIYTWLRYTCFKETHILRRNKTQVNTWK